MPPDERVRAANSGSLLFLICFIFLRSLLMFYEVEKLFLLLLAAFTASLGAVLGLGCFGGGLDRAIYRLLCEIYRLFHLW